MLKRRVRPGAAMTRLAVAERWGSSFSHHNSAWVSSRNRALSVVGKIVRRGVEVWSDLEDLVAGRARLQPALPVVVRHDSQQRFVGPGDDDLVARQCPLDELGETGLR